MHTKLYLLLGIVLLSLLACSETNEVEFDNSTYDQVIEEIEKLQGEENPLFDKITLELVEDSYYIEDEDDFERRLEFTFIIENITNQDINIKGIGYFPEELEQYFLSRNSIELSEIILEQGFYWDYTQSTIVQHPENLQDDAKAYLESEGEKIYFAFEIDDEIFYAEFVLNDEVEVDD